MSDKRLDAVLDRNRNVLCFTTTENVVEWLKEQPMIRSDVVVRIGTDFPSVEMSVSEYLRGETEKKTVYEVWSFGGNPMTKYFESKDPVEIVHWIRKFPSNERYFNVHPRGPNFHSQKRIAHNFIALHHMAVAEDIVKKAFESGSPDGVAKDIIGLMFGR